MGNDYRLVILMGAFTILGSLIVETRSLHSFWKASNQHASTLQQPRTITKNNKMVLLDHSTAATAIPSDNHNIISKIPINSNSTIASDMPQIWHDSKRQAICVRLPQTAKCPRPALLGRLSGPALALLEWNTTNHHHELLGDNNNNNNNNNDGHVQCGSYKDQWLEAGTYFLEILVLFCNDFGVNSMVRMENESSWLSYNFQPDCMEDPANNRITAKQVSIQIQESTTPSENPNNIGRWVSNQTDPLYTRYQPLRCRRNPELQERCAVPMNDTMLQSYSFEWEHNKIDDQWKKLKLAAKQRRPLPKICLVGYSHSRFLKRSFGAIGLGNHVQHIQARYPSDVGAWLFDHYHTNHSCSSFVVGVAQWPGSLMQGAPYLLDRFYADMQRIVKEAATTFANTNSVKVYLRSVHHIPIGDATGACPMKDWRSPLVMEGYTHVMQKAVQEIQSSVVEFLDTRFIVSPMWDGAFDWIHLSPQVSDVEALYMASIIWNNVLNEQKVMAVTKK